MLPNTYFKGKLDGKNSWYFRSQLDYNLKSTSDRLDKVRDILYPNGTLDNFFLEYFDQDREPRPYFKVNLRCSTEDNLFAGDALSEHDTVCKELEKMADYILMNPEERKLTKSKDYKYNFFVDKKKFEIANKEISLEGFCDGNENILNYLVRQGYNFKKEKTQKILPKDFKDKELSCLNDYQRAIESLRVKINYSSPSMAYKLKSQISAMKDDMIQCKDKIKGTIYFKSPMPDSTDLDYETFDFFDFKHVKALLPISPRSLMTDVGCLVYTLDKLINSIPFSPTEKKVLQMYRNQIPNNVIAKKMSMVDDDGKVDTSFVPKVIKSCIEKIINKYEIEYEDLHYLNNVRGKYKKCNRCGEIKLINNNRYFAYDSTKKDGFNTLCKCCKQKSSKID